jgi:hypothetical protein
MLGVALAFSVHLINASALSEFSQAVMDIGAAQELFGRSGQLSRIDVRLKPGSAVAGLALGLAVSTVLVHVVNPQSFHWIMNLRIPWGRLLLLCAAVVLAGRAAAGKDAVLAVKEDWCGRAAQVRLKRQRQGARRETADRHDLPGQLAAVGQAEGFDHDPGRARRKIDGAKIGIARRTGGVASQCPGNHIGAHGRYGRAAARRVLVDEVGNHHPRLAQRQARCTVERHDHVWHGLHGQPAKRAGDADRLEG